MAQTKGKINSSTIPIWFIIITCWLLSFRVYAKLTQAEAPNGQGVAWVTPTQFVEMTKKPGGINRDLVLYEFTADWCPPCKKRERTVFRAPHVISEINDNFIPVRVDLTNDDLSNIPATKNLTQLYSVYSIPRCVITLKSGEKVDDDRYLFSDNFANFITKSVKKADTVRAKVAVAKGDYELAMKNLSKDILTGNISIDSYNYSDYLLSHHLLIVTKRQVEVEPMMKKSFDLTAEYYKESTVKEPLAWLKKLNSYLRDQISDEQLLDDSPSETNQAIYNLAIGLKQLRLDNKEKALKALHKAAVLSAKNYQSDGLSEPIVRELEK